MKANLHIARQLTKMDRKSINGNSLPTCERCWSFEQYTQGGQTS